MRRSGQVAARAGPGCDHNAERGLTLIEVLIALGIFAAVATTFLFSMSTSTKAVITTQEHVSAESLAKSQMEYIKHQDYRVDMLYTKLDIPADYAGYNIVITGQRMNPRGDSAGNDDGIQLIRIAITRGGKTVFTLEGYKRFSSQ